MPPRPPHLRADEQIDGRGSRARALKRILFEGGFAGMCFPKEYGGQGLSPEYQRVFTEESAPYEMPVCSTCPTLTIFAPTLLDFGTEEQKRAHVPKMFSGEELWVQFLSEPTGGSDLAGLVTRADKDGDVWILNGSKIWSTGAYRCRLRPLPGPDRLACSQTSRAHDVHREDPPTRYRGPADQDGRTVTESFARSSSTTSPFRPPGRRPGQRRMDGGLAAPVPRA